MKLLSILLLVCLLACESDDSPNAFESTYAFYSPFLKDSVHCIQYGSSTIDENGVIDYQYIKEELVDTNAALVKLKAKFISADNLKHKIRFELEGDTLEGDTLEGHVPFTMIENPNFSNREVLLSGRINIHPHFKFNIDALLLMGIKKALVNH